MGSGLGGYGGGLDIYLVDDQGKTDGQQVSMLAAFGSVTVGETIDEDSHFPTLKRVWDYKSTLLEPDEIVGLRDEVELLIRTVRGEMSGTIVEDELQLLRAFCSVAIARSIGLCFRGP